MNVQSKVIALISQRAKNLGIEVNEKGYVKSVNDNLITNYDSWSQIEKELRNGAGNELDPVNGNPPKFLAIHSSSALCVNTFALVKDYRNFVSIFGESNFQSARFEMKLPTGISTPHLDFFLESSNTVIGIESKFTESLVPKRPHNLEKYLQRRDQITDINDDLFDLMDYYIQNSDPQFLDVAQLLKHSIGLLKYSIVDNKRPMLVYIYWTPEDDGYMPIEYKQHEIEIAAFSDKINQIIDFTAIRYKDFWDDLAYNSLFNKHVLKLMDRYLISAKLL